MFNIYNTYLNILELCVYILTLHSVGYSMETYYYTLLTILKSGFHYRENNAILTSKIKKNIVIKNKCKKNWICAIDLGSNPHSKAASILDERNIKKIRQVCKML